MCKREMSGEKIGRRWVRGRGQEEDREKTGKRERTGRRYFGKRQI